MRIVLTGATGMVGRGVLLEALDDPEVAHVLALGRRPTGESHPKLRELSLQDFSEAANVQEELRGHDACLHCMGVSSIGMSEADYTRVTHDHTLALARAFLAANPGSVFAYVSGQGTDSTEKGRSMWARVKGRTENALLAMPFRAAYMFRPGFIKPERGIVSRTGWARTFYAALSPLSTLTVKAGGGTSTTLLGLAMLEAATGEPAARRMGTKEINDLGRRRLARRGERGDHKR